MKKNTNGSTRTKDKRKWHKQRQKGLMCMVFLRMVQHGKNGLAGTGVA